MKAPIILALSCMLGMGAPAWAKTPGEVPIGGQLREVQMQGLSGASSSLSAFRGKPLVINVWASWCGPCRMEMGSLQRLAKRYGGKQFNVIGISTDDYRDKAAAMLQQTGISFSNYIDSKLVLENMLGADRLPLTLLVDDQGRVLAKVYGAKEWDSPEAIQFISKTFGLRL